MKIKDRSQVINIYFSEVIISVESPYGGSGGCDGVYGTAHQGAIPLPGQDTYSASELFPGINESLMMLDRKGYDTWASPYYDGNSQGKEFHIRSSSEGKGRSGGETGIAFRINLDEDYGQLPFKPFGGSGQTRGDARQTVEAFSRELFRQLGHNAGEIEKLLG